MVLQLENVTLRLDDVPAPVATSSDNTGAYELLPIGSELEASGAETEAEAAQLHLESAASSLSERPQFGLYVAAGFE
jgi:hypothetical protein